MRQLLGLGLLLAAAACGGRVVSDESAGRGSGGAGAALAQWAGGAPSSDEPLATGGLLATGGSDAASLPPGMVLFDPATDITSQACVGKQWENETRPVLLQMVVDISSSMAEPPNSTAAETKWELTRAVLIHALDHLPAAAIVGVTFYPNQTTPSNLLAPDDHGLCIDSSADLPLTLLGNKQSQARADIVNRLNAITIPVDAGTPTHDAYQLGLDSLLSLVNAQPSYATAPKYVLLVTDGEPTISLGCVGYGTEQHPVDVSPIIGEIEQAFTIHQIETLVIGTPGSDQVNLVHGDTDARPWLSEAATAGNTASLRPGCSNMGDPTFCHFDLTQAGDTEQELGTALQEITGAIVPCKYTLNPLEGTVIDPTVAQVEYTGGDGVKYSVVYHQTSGDCTFGWRFTDSTATVVEICGETCEFIQNDSFAHLHVLLGCQSLVTP